MINIKRNSTIKNYENAIYLDQANIPTIKYREPLKDSTKQKKANKAPTFYAFNDIDTNASKFSTAEYQIKPVSATLMHKKGFFTIGTSYDSFLDSAEINYSTKTLAQLGQVAM